jgi:hypothetical protein
MALATRLLGADGLWHQVLTVLAAGVCAVIAYLVVARLLGSREMAFLRDLVTRKRLADGG